LSNKPATDAAVALCRQAARNEKLDSAMLRDRKLATVNHTQKWPRQPKATNKITFRCHLLIRRLMWHILAEAA